jgi:hypothetical protein
LFIEAILLRCKIYVLALPISSTATNLASLTSSLDKGSRGKASYMSAFLANWEISAFIECSTMEVLIPTTVGTLQCLLFALLDTLFVQTVCLLRDHHELRAINLI